MYVADLGNDVIYVINRQNLTELSRFGGGGRQAGEFHWPHMVATDSDGNVYVGEVDGAGRTQKFLRYGATGCSGTGSRGSRQVPRIKQTCRLLRADRQMTYMLTGIKKDYVFTTVRSNPRKKLLRSL